MFGKLFGNPTGPAPQQAPAQTQQPQQQAPQQQAPQNPQQQQAPNPQQNNSTVRSETLQGQPVLPPVSTAPSMYDIINRVNPAARTQQATNPTDPAQFAQDFISSMLSAPETVTAPAAPRINPEALREAFGSVDFTTGLDLAQLTEALQGRGAQGTDPNALVQAALQGQGLNIITAIAPLMNQMVQHAMERAVTESTQRTQHNMTASSLVTEFVDAHPYAKNPMMMNMVTQFCNTIVAQNPSNIDRGAIFTALDLVFRGMSETIRPEPKPGSEHIPANAQTSFDDLFR